MKIKLLQSNFSKAINQVSRIVSSRTTLPVLNNILISAKKGQITLAATDLEVGITTGTIGKIEEEGEITLAARLLSDFVLNNKDESIEIIVENQNANLKSAHYEANINGISADEFPSIPILPKESFCQIKKDDFASALKKVAIAPASDETRPVLAGVLFQFSGKELIMAATDSYRLAEIKMMLEESIEEKKLIVPNRTIVELLRLLSSNQAENVAISSTENQVCFKIGDTNIVSRLIEGAYPNYSQIIPSKFNTESVVNISDFVSAVKMSSLFAKESANNNIKIAVDGNELTVSSLTSQIGNTKSNIPAETKGGKIEITFNAKYVLDVLHVLNSDKIEIQLIDSLSPGLIKAKDDSGFLYIIMPLKLDN